MSRQLAQKPTSSRYRVLDTIRRHPNISRVELASLTDFSRAAVTGITQGLLDASLIVETPLADGKEGGRGRPRKMLDINAEAGYVLGIKLSLHQMSFSVTDFTGNVVHTMHLPFRGNQNCDVTLDIIEMGIQRCLKNADIKREKILGVCIGIPGYVSHETGMCHWSPIFTERDIPVARLLQERLGLKIFIENDANLVTLAEHWFGEGRGLSCFAVVTVEHGIGMGLVVDDDLYRGANGIGPELGHSKVEIDGRLCRCGQLGCVEAYASDYAILREADVEFSIDAYNENPKAYHETISKITERARNNDEHLSAVFKNAGKRLGQAVANMIAILNPQTVIFTGDGMRAGEILITPAIEEARRLKLSGDKNETEFITHIWGDEVWARGAAALTLQHIYAEPDEKQNFSSSKITGSTKLKPTKRA
ncbi:MAG: ROK family transcriptional regulator [Sneathiella sp.]|nr:ROK family transcriptional regulator [Sneathiella sp.]